ncbi:MAG: (deoxy)nucleoside triphosphate pyrophosphohydrolase [Sandaracinaceae bacterium]|nr:(deoxy)nucleoside triphosphate pyrophosphohydrolase [Sandaracinaceae bacterium]
MTIIVAAAVIREEPGAPVLLTRRPEGVHLAGLWELPGGKVEDGEDPERALVRELREECALEIEVGDILEVAWHRYEVKAHEAEAPGGSRAEPAAPSAGARSKDVLLLFYDCRAVGREVQHVGVADHAWVPPSELDRYSLPPPDARLVVKLKAGR